MRRSPSRGGRGAARAGDARREGRLRSGRRMAEVSRGERGGKRGAGCGGPPDEGHLLAAAAAAGRAVRATGRSTCGLPSPPVPESQRGDLGAAPRFS